MAFAVFASIFLIAWAELLVGSIKFLTFFDHFRGCGTELLDQRLLPLTERRNWLFLPVSSKNMQVFLLPATIKRAN